jgi:hypothetical protein
MFFEQTISSIQFSKWIWQDSENRLTLKMAIPIIVLQFIVFKFLYPFPNFMPPDSFSYIEAANYHQYINVWSIGYSWFLLLFKSLSHSSTALVFFQYFILEISILYFLFSIRYMISTSKWLFRIMLVLSILNPLILHIGNFVSSDAIFSALSLIWFTQLLWLIFKPKPVTLLLHVAILIVAFIFRYNALYYPLISIMVIFFNNKLINRLKFLFIGLTLFLLSVFIGKTQYEYYQETGVIQFSAFAGWQLGSNALYGYAHAKLDSPSTVPGEFRDLHRIVNTHMKYLNRFPSFLRPDHKVDIYYLWDFNSPLRVYMDKYWEADKTRPFFKRWAFMAPLYGSYGRYIIKKHPMQFIRYYIWPNFIKYYSPPTGFLGYYNLERDTVDRIAATWFEWKTNKIHSYFKNKKIFVSDFFPTGFAVINLVFLSGLICYITLGEFKRNKQYIRKILQFTLVVWLANMFFSVFAAPIELRYQLFPMIMTLAFSCLFIAYIFSESKRTSLNHEKLPSNIIEGLST